MKIKFIIFYTLLAHCFPAEFIGHRGAKQEKPENTLLGFNHAIKYGVSILEVDCHLTSDGIPIAIHDSTLNRTTNGTGEVDEYNFFQIKTFNAGHFWGINEQIPSIEEVLLLAKEKNVKVLLDLKVEGLANSISEIVNRIGFPIKDLQCLCWTNSQTIDFRQSIPGISIFWIMGGRPKDVLPIYAQNAILEGVSGYFFWPAIIEEEDVNNIHNLGMKIYITLNSDIYDMVDYNVDGISMDYPRYYMNSYKEKCWNKFKELYGITSDWNENVDSNNDGVLDFINFVCGGDFQLNVNNFNNPFQITSRVWHKLKPYKEQILYSEDLINWSNYVPQNHDRAFFKLKGEFYE